MKNESLIADVEIRVMGNFFLSYHYVVQDQAKIMDYNPFTRNKRSLLKGRLGYILFREELKKVQI